jgi:hypothetical protein
MTHLIYLGKYYYAEYLPDHPHGPRYHTRDGHLVVSNSNQFHTFDRRLDALRFLYNWRKVTYGHNHHYRQLHPDYWRLPYTYPKLLRILQSHFPQDFI